MDDAWHVVAVDEAVVAVATFPTLAEVVAHLRSLEAAAPATRVTVFRGERVAVSRPPFRFLLPSDGPPVPLFDPPVAAEPDDDATFGGKGDDYAAATAALVLSHSPPATATAADADDEEDGELV